MGNDIIDDDVYDELSDVDGFMPVLQRIGPDGNVQNIELKTGRDIDTDKPVFEPHEIQTWRTRDGEG